MKKINIGANSFYFKKKINGPNDNYDCHTIKFYII